MAEIYMGDWADFLGVSMHTINRAVLHLKDFPAPVRTKGSKTATIRIWTIAQYDAYIALLGGVEEAIAVFLKASSDYVEANRHKNKKMGRAKIERVKPEKPIKPRHESKYDNSKTFWCHSCKFQHDISLLADNGRRLPICQPVFDRIAANRAIASNINAGQIRTFGFTTAAA